MGKDKENSFLRRSPGDVFVTEIMDPLLIALSAVFPVAASVLSFAVNQSVNPADAYLENKWTAPYTLGFIAAILIGSRLLIRLAWSGQIGRVQDDDRYTNGALFDRMYVWQWSLGGIIRSGLSITALVFIIIGYARVAHLETDTQANAGTAPLYDITHTIYLTALILTSVHVAWVIAHEQFGVWSNRINRIATDKRSGGYRKMESAIHYMPNVAAVQPLAAPMQQGVNMVASPMYTAPVNAAVSQAVPRPAWNKKATTIDGDLTEEHLEHFPLAKGILIDSTKTYSQRFDHLNTPSQI